MRKKSARLLKRSSSKVYSKEKGEGEKKNSNITKEMEKKERGNQKRKKKEKKKEVIKREKKEKKEKKEERYPL
jgi:3'-phosphoadenosine 5'-phosphosulfate (PAPS) 3'-phosphatase